MIWKYVRKHVRLIRFSWVIAGAGVIYFFTVKLRGKSSDLRARAEWMCWQSRRILAVLGIQVERHGAIPAGGLLAANHLGYLDILVLGAAQPMIFLSKNEVRNWPIFGPLTACAGTLFIRRDKKSDVARFDESFARVVDAGLTLGIFPEGTSSDGHRVLPFHSSLFAAAAAAKWPVTPAWIGYEAEGGPVENDVCYWGDMTFFTHFPRLIALRKIRATVVYGTPVAGETDRKEIARQLHRQVCGLGERFRPGLAGPAGKGLSLPLTVSHGGPAPAGPAARQS
jgi:1-acyl-sn-glycerol-3-phosphate acyltransferase